MVDFSQLWTSLDWIIVILYFIGVVGVGMLMHKKASKNFKSFFVAGRRLTIPVIIGVAAAGWYDSWTFVGLSECGATMGICILLINVVPSAILRLPLAIWIGPFTRDKIPDYVVTMPDLVEYLFDRKTKLLSTITPMAEVLYCAALLFVIGDVLHLVSGVSIIVTMIIAGLGVILYTTMAGLWALAVTDLIQFAIMTVAAGALGIGILVEFGGVEPIWTTIAETNPERLTLTGGLPISEMIGWGMGGIAMYTSAQSYQRFGAAKGGADIRAAYTIMMFIGVAMCAMMVLTGMAVSVAYPDLYEDNYSMAYWGTVFSILPPGVRGLLVAAIFAAVMSTISADLLVAAGVLVNDIIKGFFNKNMTDKGAIKGTRIGIVGFGIFVIIGTIFWSDGIARAWYYIGGFMVAVFFVPIVAGLFYKKKTRKAGFVSVSLSMILYFTWEFALGVPFGLQTNALVWAFSAVVFFIACNVTYKSENGEGRLEKNEGGRINDGTNEN